MYLGQLSERARCFDRIEYYLFLCGRVFNRLDITICICSWRPEYAGMVLRFHYAVERRREAFVRIGNIISQPGDPVMIHFLRVEFTYSAQNFRSASERWFAFHRIRSFPWLILLAFASYHCNGFNCSILPVLSQPLAQTLHLITPRQDTRQLHLIHHQD